MTNGRPRRVGVNGSATVLFSDHIGKYLRLSADYRCCTSNCLNKGIRVNLEMGEIVACSVHLREYCNPSSIQSEAPKVDPSNKKVVTMSEQDTTLEDNADDMPRMKGDQKGMFGHVVASTDTSASESRTDREKELKRIKWGNAKNPSPKRIESETRAIGRISRLSPDGSVRVIDRHRQTL